MKATMQRQNLSPDQIEFRFPSFKTQTQITQRQYPQEFSPQTQQEFPRYQQAFAQNFNCTSTHEKKYENLSEKIERISKKVESLFSDEKKYENLSEKIERISNQVESLDQKISNMSKDLELNMLIKYFIDIENKFVELKNELMSEKNEEIGVVTRSNRNKKRKKY